MIMKFYFYCTLPYKSWGPNHYSEWATEQTTEVSGFDFLQNKNFLFSPQTQTGAETLSYPLGNMNCFSGVKSAEASS